MILHWILNLTTFLLIISNQFLRASLFHNVLQPTFIEPISNQFLEQASLHTFNICIRCISMINICLYFLSDYYLSERDHRPYMFNIFELS